MRRYLHLLSGLAMLTSCAVYAPLASADIYKCVNAKGQISFGDQPCARDSADASRSMTPGDAPSADSADANAHIQRALELLKSPAAPENPASKASLTTRDDSVHSTARRLQDNCRHGQNSACTALDSLASDKLKQRPELEDLSAKLSNQCASGKQDACDRLHIIAGGRDPNLVRDRRRDDTQQH